MHTILTSLEADNRQRFCTFDSVWGTSFWYVLFPKFVYYLVRFSHISFWANLVANDKEKKVCDCEKLGNKLHGLSKYFIKKWISEFFYVQITYEWYIKIMFFLTHYCHKFDNLPTNSYVSLIAVKIRKFSLKGSGNLKVRNESSK